jgi:hypothetical protein
VSCGIIFLIGLILLFVYFTLPKCVDDIHKCPPIYFISTTKGSALLAIFIFFALVIICCLRCRWKNEFNELSVSENGQQPIIWRLDGDEWIRYLNYIHGPNREWRDTAALPCFCCRHSSYNRLLNRQFGHIILYANCIMIDQLHFISLRTHLVQSIRLLIVDQQQQRQILGLRIHTFFDLIEGRNRRNRGNIYFDIFAPSSVSLEELRTIAQLYTGKIPGSDRFDTAPEILHLNTSTPNAFH